MSPIESDIEKRLRRVIEHQFEELRGDYVTQAEFAIEQAKITRHEEAYGDYIVGKKWILRLGIATLVSAWVSPHLMSLLTFIKALF